MPTSTLVLVKNKTINCVYVIFDLSRWKIQYPKNPSVDFATQKNPGVFHRPKKIPFGQNVRPKKILWTPPSLKYVSGAPGLLHLITVSPTPTGWAHNFTSYSRRLKNKTAITHENLKTIWFLPLKNMVVPWKIMVLPLKIFSSKEFHLMYFYSTPKKILSLCNLTLKNSICQVNQWRGVWIL